MFWRVSSQQAETGFPSAPDRRLQNLEPRQILDIHHAREAAGAVDDEEVVNGVLLVNLEGVDGQGGFTDGDRRRGHDIPDGAAGNVALF